MSSRLSRSNKLAWVSALALATALAACGGGGGDDDSGPPGTIDLSVANRDTVAHAVVAGAIGLGGTDVAVSGAGSAAAQRHLALSLLALRERALAVIPLPDEACAVSGLTRMSLDDRDNDGLPSVGDVMTFQFQQCKDSVEETIDGTTTITITEFSDSGGFAGSLQQTALAMVREDGGQQHSVTLNGTMQMTFTASNPAVPTMQLVASGPVVATVSTPVFTDTVTLMSGYTQQTVVDTQAAPPPGGVTPGRSTTTTAGRIASQAAAGEVTVATVEAIVQYADDAFARTGALNVTGRTGSLRITAVSPTDVRLDLDSNGDGTIDVTSTQRWDWLI